ncbi:hypothetical protein BC835DRAFT_1306955 [Cytidiella melzeri]|nr:hypothetical protein BC835DRAFT_1306955 [Cytidiella melzeri]
MAEAAVYLSDFIVILPQTLAYGVFVALIPPSIHIFLKHGLRSRNNIVIFSITLAAFALSTASWAATCVATSLKLAGYSAHIASTFRLVCNALLLLNPSTVLFADGVVVWRMRVLCGLHFSKRVLRLPSIMLLAMLLSISATLGLRMYGTALPGLNDIPQGPLETCLNVLQVTSQALSLITNIFATSLISIWAWHYRRGIRENLQCLHSSGDQMERILFLLVESGLAYCLSSIFVVISLMISLPDNFTLGDVYVPIHSQVAGMYPALVMVLVSTGSSVENMTSPSSAEQAVLSTVVRDLQFRVTQTTILPEGSFMVIKCVVNPESDGDGNASKDDSRGIVSRGCVGHDFEADLEA